MRDDETISRENIQSNHFKARTETAAAISLHDGINWVVVYVTYIGYLLQSANRSPLSPIRSIAREHVLSPTFDPSSS